MRTKIYRFNIAEGKHRGHHVNTDAWGVEFEGRDPETAGWCLDCHEAVDVYEVEPMKMAEEA